MVRHGAASHARLYALQAEPARPVRHERRRAVLSGHEARARCAPRASECRCNARWCRRPLRRRLADDRVQLARHPRHTRQPCGRLFELSHADSLLLRPGRLRADAMRSGGDPDYAHLTAMLAPRVALLTYNEKDNSCFAAPHALPPQLAAARPTYQLLGAGDALHEHINYDPGTHNFERDNREAHYKVIGQHWFSGNSGYSSTEIDSEKEVKTAEELAVELPSDNLDFQELAQRLMQTLPRTPTPPNTAGGAISWQTAQRDAVARVLRLGKHQRLPIEYEVSAGEFSRQTWGDVQITSWKLKIGDTWTIPALEFAPQQAKSSAIVLADSGRPGAAEQIEKLVAEGCQVIAVDPFYFGESKIKNKDFLFALLVSSVGERPLGIQASQIGAIARWLSTDRRLPEAKLIALGPRTGLIALTAAAIESRAIAAVELHESRGS